MPVTVTMPIVTLERAHPAAGRHPLGAAAWVPLHNWPAHIDGPPRVPGHDEMATGDPDPALFAVVNHGRWLAECECGAAQLASQDDHRLYCPACNSGGTGCWVRVVWPANVAAIEAVLLQRPDPQTRNWRPGEALNVLRRENEAHGVDTGPADPAVMQAHLGLRPSKV